MGRLIDVDDVISLLANHHFDDSKENTDLLPVRQRMKIGRAHV